MKGLKWLLIKFAPAIFAFLGVCLGVISYLIDFYLLETFHTVAWLLLCLVLIVNGIGVGILIKDLYSGVYIDKLTRIGNRSLFYLSLSLLIDKAEEKGLTDILLAMIDIDNFKNINDCYGHQAGDMVLVKLAEVLNQNVRGTDIAIRWGGDEFAIILPRTNSEAAYIVLERIRLEIANFDFGSRVNSNQTTISIGFASSNDLLEVARSKQCTDYIELFVGLADKALYKAKETKNTIVPFSQITNDMNH